MGSLYLVATPIGNLEDMTLRGLRVLGEVGTVAAEDTRTARRLLSHFQIRARLLSYTEHNRRSRIPQIVALLETEDVALVSEAGMPAISDPGQELVAAVVAEGYQVFAVPGASAVLSALAVSGLSTRQFLYLGFLPRRGGDRRALLTSVAAEPRTLVCFEAPSRLRDSLADLLLTLGDRRIAICRELTKLHEETLRLRISAAIARPETPRGEFTLVVEGAEPANETDLSAPSLAALRTLHGQGVTAREAIPQVAAEYKLSRRRLYEAWLALSEESDSEADLC